MKCSACYADNDAWVSVCLMCGEAVVPVELCLNGHILPPGSRECPLCPSMWPEAAPFSGPPVLRGVLLVERGTLDGALFLEVRDRDEPLSFTQPEPGRLTPVEADSKVATVRILLRPEGVSTCVKPGKGKLAYEPLKPEQSVSFGGVHLKHIPFEVPKTFGVESVTTTRGRKKKG